MYAFLTGLTFAGALLVTHLVWGATHPFVSFSPFLVPAAFLLMWQQRLKTLRRKRAERRLQAKHAARSARQAAKQTARSARKAALNRIWPAERVARQAVLASKGAQFDFIDTAGMSGDLEDNRLVYRVFALNGSPWPLRLSIGSLSLSVISQGNEHPVRPVQYQQDMLLPGGITEPQAIVVKDMLPAVRAEVEKWRARDRAMRVRLHLSGMVYWLNVQHAWECTLETWAGVNEPGWP